MWQDEKMKVTLTTFKETEKPKKETSIETRKEVIETLRDIPKKGMLRLEKTVYFLDGRIESEGYMMSFGKRIQVRIQAQRIAEKSRKAVAHG